MKSIVLPLAIFCSCVPETTTSTTDMVASESILTEESNGYDCCEENGNIEGKENICATSRSPKCVGCDGAPVLCETSCVSHGETLPCCLASDGSTVPCP